nr:hypothetical protein CFP56_21611 [Quercus suber]
MIDAHMASANMTTRVHDLEFWEQCFDWFSHRAGNASICLGEGSGVFWRLEQSLLAVTHRNGVRRERRCFHERGRTVMFTTHLISQFAPRIDNVKTNPQSPVQSRARQHPITARLLPQCNPRPLPPKLPQK